MSLMVWIVFVALVILVTIVIGVNLSERKMINAPTCGHDGLKKYIPEEHAWFCDECYQEWKYDKIGIGKCR